MNTALPQPLSLPWELKPVSSARAGSEVLEDGRLKFWIKHDTIKGVTPAMLVWWFSNLEGDVEVDGRMLNRYRVWHPFDHVHARYVRRLADGSIGPGAQIELLEYLGRNPKYKVDIVTTIEKLDEEGYIHNPVSHGVSLARMEYTFRETGDGTVYENCLIVPRDHGSWFFRKVVVPILFPESKGQAWIKHNVEEVGCFENFLPSLYRAHTGTDSTKARLEAIAGRFRGARPEHRPSNTGSLVDRSEDRRGM
ncbi:MAG: DAPG hydrolase family protein [Gaiellaceae bacterium]|jgi:hypothetical protein